jgi:hypothetical protein
MKFIINGMINNTELKYKILKYIYEYLDWNTYRYKIVLSENILKEIKEKDILITYQMNSYNYLLCFFMIDKIKYSIII